MAKREIGDLTPFHSVLEELRERERIERELRGEDDVVRALVMARDLVARAFDQAERPDVLYIEEYAQQQGITLEAAYKRFARHQIPGARKENGRIVVPVEAIAA